MRLMTVSAVVLVTAGCGDDTALPPSPVLALALNEEVRVLDIDGRSERWAAARAYKVEWSPDGRHLAYSTPGRPSMLFIDDADTRERVFAGQHDWTTAFAWAPDGSRLALRDGDYQAGGISIVEADTGDARALTPASGDDLDPAWSPDGRRLLIHRRITATTYKEIFKIMVADLETGALARLTDSDDTVTEVGAKFSADGRWVAFVGGPSPYGLNLWVYGPDGTRVLRDPPYGIGMALPRPGSHEFLVREYDGIESARIVLFDPERDVADELDRTDYRHFWWENVVWSPDGRRIAFEDDTDDCSVAGTDLYWYDVESREKRLAARLPVTDDVIAVSWSSDGERLVALARDCFPNVAQDDPRWGTARSDVYVITVATGAVERVHVEPAIPSWDISWRP